MANTTNTQSLPTLDPEPVPGRSLRRRLTSGAAVFAVGAGLGWLGGAVATDTTVAAVPEAVSSPRSPDAIERSALPEVVSSPRSADAVERSALVPGAVSSPRSPDAVERSAGSDAESEAERRARSDHADCLRWSRGITPC